MKRQVVAGALAGAALGIALWRNRRPLADTLGVARAGGASPTTLAANQRRRVGALIAYARAHSPYYRALYQRLPPDASDLRELPIVTKPDLMAHFDEWVTDPAVTRSSVEAFVADPALIGKRYLGRYAVWTTSGTTGKPGIFVHDRRALAVYGALGLLRSYRWLTPALLRRLLRRARVATLVATGGHFAMADWFEWERHSLVLRRSIQLFSALTPLADLVRKLNDFQPGLLLGYPSVIKLLATEQRAGRLRIAPVFIGTGGEWLEPGARAEMAEAFHCVTRDNYGASEFPFAAAECDHGWLHVNADWLLLEPVDATYRPVPPGQPSHTALLTNLVNRVQPLIRYDLGDSITVKPDPCPCGFPLPAIRVEGRKGDILHLATPSGATVAILPLAVGTVIEETPGVRRAQLIQTGRSALTLRLEVDERAGVAAPGEVWEQVERRLRDYFAAHGITSVTIVRAPEPPQQDAVGGKFREVWSALPESESAALGAID